MRMPLYWVLSMKSHIRHEENITYLNGNLLRSYEVEGVNWLLNRRHYKHSCIMADKMGFGKTEQCVTFINAPPKEFEHTAPALVVATLSTIVNLEREFHNWTDLRVLTYHCAIQVRDIINDD